MKVLVTGGCGFLGYHVCAYFRQNGASAIAYDNMAKHEFARNPYMREEARDHNRAELAKAGVEIAVEDIRDKETLTRMAAGCDYLCHTAAQPAMTISWENPELDFSTNTRGTFNVLEAARLAKIPVAICSSIHTFGPDRINASLGEEATRYVRDPVAIGEDEPLLQGSVTPLHASKRADEIYTPEAGIEPGLALHELPQRQFEGAVSVRVEGAERQALKGRGALGDGVVRPHGEHRGLAVLLRGRSTGAGTTQPQRGAGGRGAIRIRLIWSTISLQFASFARN